MLPRGLLASAWVGVLLLALAKGHSHTAALGATSTVRQGHKSREMQQQKRVLAQEPGGPVKREQGPQQQGGSSSRMGGTLSDTLVCWRSTDPSSSPGGELPGLAVFGPGCSQCVAGALCSFVISIMPPASWLTPPEASRERELNVEILGPSAHAGLLSPLGAADSSFLVTYRIWDAGLYLMHLRSSCGTLNYTSSEIQMRPHEVGSWKLEVFPLANREPDVQVSPGNGTDRGPKLLQDPGATAAITSPCDSGLYERWLKQDDGKYRWTGYPCAGDKASNPAEWMGALNRNGIHEINIIGDSHQRYLAMHLRYLISGELNKTHGPRGASRWEPFSYTIGDAKSGGQLKINFGWVPGIYVSRTEWKCSLYARREDKVDYPDVPLSADVWLVEAGYWTGTFCMYPEAAFAAFLPGFLLQTKMRSDIAATNATRLVRPNARKFPLFAYRTAPPKPTETKGCQKLTNKYGRYANSFARSLAPSFGATIFDSWLIEAARFRDNCVNDHHYSCIGPDLREKDKSRLHGDVGEAIVYAFVSFLLHS